MEHEAAPQHDAPTDQSVAAEGRRRAGTARMAPILRGGYLEGGFRWAEGERGALVLTDVVGRAAGNKGSASMIMLVMMVVVAEVVCRRMEAQHEVA